MLCLGFGVVLSPFVSLHEVKAHQRDRAQHFAEHVSTYALEAPGHSHGGHDHLALQVSSNKVQYRPDSRAGIASPAGFFIRASISATTHSLANNATSKFPRSRHPLSLSNALRI